MIAVALWIYAVGGIVVAGLILIGLGGGLNEVWMIVLVAGFAAVFWPIIVVVEIWDWILRCMELVSDAWNDDAEVTRRERSMVIPPHHRKSVNDALKARERMRWVGRKIPG